MQEQEVDCGADLEAVDAALALMRILRKAMLYDYEHGIVDAATSQGITFIEIVIQQLEKAAA